MFRHPAFAFAAVALATSLSPVWAQRGTEANEEPVRVTLGRVLTQARDSGALERLLGERFYRYDRVQQGDDPEQSLADKDPDLIMIVKGAHDPEQGSLALSFTLLNPEVRLALAYTYGFDGKLRSLDVGVKQGLQDMSGKGVVAEDGTLPLELRREEKVETRLIAWHDDALPELFSLVVLPVLADQGLPDAMTFYAFEGEDMRLNDSRTTTITRESEPVTSKSGPAEAFTMREDGRQKGQTFVLSSEDDRGRLVLIDLDGRKQITPISDADGAAWLDRFGAE